MSGKSIASKLLVTSLLIALGACSLFRGQETGGQYVDDSAITTKVKADFLADSHVSSVQINVETLRGVVQLSGFADTAATEARAVQIAEQVNGVKSVQDNIIVKKPTM